MSTSHRISHRVPLTTESEHGEKRWVWGGKSRGLETAAAHNLLRIFSRRPASTRRAAGRPVYRIAQRRQTRLTGVKNFMTHKTRGGLTREV